MGSARAGRRGPARRRTWAAAVLGMSASGCVERILRVETVPAAATVWVNGTAAGRSPVDVPFTYYGTYRVDAGIDWGVGWRDWTGTVELDPPWYQVFPLDLFAELLDPRTHVDRHLLTVELEAYAPPPPLQSDAERQREHEALVRRAGEFAAGEDGR